MLLRQLAWLYVTFVLQSMFSQGGAPDTSVYIRVCVYVGVGDFKIFWGGDFMCLGVTFIVYLFFIFFCLTFFFLFITWGQYLWEQQNGAQIHFNYNLYKPSGCHWALLSLIKSGGVWQTSQRKAWWRWHALRGRLHHFVVSSTASKQYLRGLHTLIVLPMLS